MEIQFSIDETCLKRNRIQRRQGTEVPLVSDLVVAQEKELIELR